MKKYDIKQWVAADGLMSLNKGGRRPPYKPEAYETCDNDNGILYTAQYVWLTNGKDPIANGLTALEAIHLTAVPGHPGLYFRQWGRDNYINSQDNYLGMAMICVFNRNTKIFKEVVSWWPVLNDMKPKWPHLERWDWPSGIFQGHDWFIFYLAAGMRPGFITTAWFVGNLIWSYYKMKRRTHFSEHLLAWVRCQIVERSYHLMGKDQTRIVKWAVELFKKKMRDHEGIQLYFQYFNGEHPNYILTRGLQY